MDRTFERWILLGLSLTVVLIVLSANLAYRNTVQLREDARSVAHSLEVLETIGKVKSLARDAETGQRGYVITGEPSYLEPYRESVAVIGRQVDRLSALTTGRPDQRASIAELREGLGRKLEELRETIVLRDSKGFEEARRVMLTDRGRVAMDEVRTALDQIEGRERTRLRDRQEQSSRSYSVAVATGLLTAALGLGLVIAFTILLRRYLIAGANSAAAIFHEKEGFRTTLASIGDAVIVTDMAGRITLLNSVAQSLTGWPEADAVGRPLEEILRLLNDQTKEVVDNPVTRVFDGKVTVGLEDHTVLIARDGREIPVDDNAAPILDGDGKVRGAVLVFRDVTEHRRAERSLLEAKAYAESIVDTVRQPLLVLGPDLRIASAGRAFYRTFGLKPEDVQGRSFVELDDCRWEIQDLRERLEAVLTHGSSFEDFEVDCFLPELGRRTMWLSASGVDRDGGQAELILVAIEDVTAQKQSERMLREQAAALKEADARKNEFLATLAHELRNPLAPIRNSLYIMQMTSDDREALEASRAVIDRQVLQLVRLVDDLLDVSRINRDRLELKKEIVDLAAILESSVEAARPQAASREIDLQVSLPPTPIRLDGDPVRLAQVFSNILNNASKYTERGGHIRLTSERIGDEAVVTIRDDGMGIPTEMLPRIFQMFTQVDHSLDRSQGGLGIGLALVRRLVEMHGGRVDAHSDGLGRGSEFVVRLPVVVDEVPVAPAPDFPAEESSGPVRKRIVVVDDNQDSADSLARMLVVLGNDVLTAYHGAEAVEMADESRPDLAFIDISLPDLDGYEVARQIRRRPWGKEMILVALTGWGNEEDRRRAIEAGFDHHITKPAELAALSSILTM
jgi:PAS domain S-box-containing protein